MVKGQTRDLIDAYIQENNRVTENGESQSTFYGKVGWKNCVSSVVEIFVAGGETMANTLKWGIVYLSQHQDFQRRLQQEIDDVVGKDRDPTLLDRLRMPYAEAVLLEMLRFSSVILLGVPHELLEDVPFHGYTLPKGLIIMANMYHIHHDPEIWGDPNEFRPDRFLGDERQNLKDNLIPFQAGKRQCMGEPLARDVLFLFLVKLFQQFNFRPDPNVSKENYFKADVGIALVPMCTKFVVTSR